MIQTAVYLMHSDASVCIANLKEMKCDLPCSNELWGATEIEWRALPAPEPVWFPSAMTDLLDGHPVRENIGSFAVICLLGAILVHIATYERLAWYKSPNSDEIWSTSMQRTLRAWEATWKSHPHANPNPYSDEHGPLMADALPLLNTAYFHIYVPRTLQRIKEMLMTLVQRPEVGQEELRAILMPQSDAEREGLFRAATHAAHSLLVRARLGYNLVARTACLDMGFHYVYTGFEAGFSGLYQTN